jgi:hypothetical protein
MLETVFGGMFATLMTLCYHRVIARGSMSGAESWRDGNYVRRLYPSANLCIKSITEVLAYLGEDSTKASFFESYLRLVKKSGSCVAADIAWLPGEAGSLIKDCENDENSAEPSTRLIFVYDSLSGRPLYYRYMSGNLGNAGVLLNTVSEMKRSGVSTSIALPDNGLYSEEDLKTLLASEVKFLIRIPCREKIFKTVVSCNSDIESAKYALTSGGRCLFIKEGEIEVFGRKAFTYLVLNPERRGLEIAKIVYKATKSRRLPGWTDLSGCGKMVLLSNERLGKEAAVPLYYTRKDIGKLLWAANADREILPASARFKPDFKGFMLLLFISSVIANIVEARLGGGMSLAGALSCLKSLKCDVRDNRVYPNEASENQRRVFKRAKVAIPKSDVTT